MLNAALREVYGVPNEVLNLDHGMKRRFFCEAESQIDLAISAAQKALKAAGRVIDDIDLIISGCAVPYQTIPSTAPLIMKTLGLPDGAAAAFDVNSTCLGFVSGLDLASRWLRAKDAQYALVISSEVASRALPWDDDPQTAILFGDGAGAAVLSSSANGPNKGVIASHMRSFPSAYEASEIGAGGTRFDFHSDRLGFEKHSRFAMNGRDLFRVTATHFVRFLEELLDKAGWTRQDVDIVVPHQASPHALSHMIKLCGFQADQVVNIVSDFGNQIAASIPFALDFAVQNGQVRRNSKVLLIGTSAGVSFGGIALEY
jgi:3-oxoacyl-[acyl-carrier-protein] synthase-3